MGQKGPQLWSRAPLPFGAIRIRQHSRRVKVRMIKIADRSHPKGFRWIAYARWWWEQNRGPVPEGMRIVHENGDHLDDRPENYVLASGGDVLFLAREWDPKLEDRNRKACRKGTAEHNRLRSRIYRHFNILPDHWYPVDHAARQIINDPHGSRLLLLRAYGLEVGETDRSGRGSLAAMFGWPGLKAMQACILNVLAGGGLLRSFEIRERVAALRNHHGIKPAELTATTFYSCSWALRRAGLVEKIRESGVLLRRYRITPAGLAARRCTSAYVPVRGSEAVRLEGYRRVPVAE